MHKEKANGKLGIALVGLGYYSTYQLAPALQETADCYLAGIVTGSPEKAERWKQRYGIPERNVYDYSSFDTIKNNAEIDIVYIVLPNAMHAEYVIRAAAAGKHVICEKPMALTVEDCDRMIAACSKAGKMLSIGYRLHFDPFHREIVRLATEQAFGKVKKINAGFGFVAQPGIWRLDKTLAGGGPLQDLAVYGIQAACYVLGIDPIAVIAKEGINSDPERFKTVEESLTWQLEFPDNVIANGKASYNEEYSMLLVECERGWLELDPAFNYCGLGGQTSNGKIELTEINQQAKQMDDFAQAIKQQRPSPVPGEMGRRDVQIIQAIYEAMQSGKKVKIV